MKKQVSIAINKIKELEFSITTNTEAKEKLSIGFGVATAFDIKREIFEIQVIYDLKDSEDIILVHIKVLNEFSIQNIKQFLTKDKKELKLPDAGLITMLSLSISHTRALLAKSTSGTPFEDNYLPIVNPTEIAKEIFQKNKI
ncbi:MAG: hypothetical protein ABI315_04735 [Bacteroidia bacterium]